MVRKGNFELRLIYADTKVPFKEHAHTDSKVYAEVEPKVEYYLQMRSHHPKGVVFRFEVDGKDLGYQGNRKSGYHKWYTFGLWHREEDEEFHNALKFHSLYRRPIHDDGSDSDSDSSDNGHWTGFVKLNVYEYVPDGHKFRKKKDVASAWYPDTETIAKGLNMSQNKKSCNSVKGLTKTKKIQGRKKSRDYKVGSLLESVTLHYCSTVGLIAAKVLTRPGLTIHNNRSDSSMRPSKRQRSGDGETNELSHVVQSQTIEKISTYEVIELS
jgi:hypothetical protein